AGVNQRGCIRQYGQHGRLGPGQPVRRAAEVSPSRGIESYHITPKGCVGTVQRQSGRFTMACFQPDGKKCLHHLLPEGTGLITAHPDHLHTKGTSATNDAPAPDILYYGPAEGDQVYPRVIKESFIFKGDNAT